MNAGYQKIVSTILVVAGIVILLVAILPIVSYVLLSRQNFPSLISPLAKDEEEKKDVDYTRASNWFVGGAEGVAFEKTEVKFYTLSIPALEIESASVAIGGEDLSKSLIHYPGTALPGKTGNSVIFGHSVLPIFFDPDNYLSIFSTLSTLKKGDEIIVDYDSIRYKYVVNTLFEVTPNDIQIMEQNSSDSYLTLVTCTPPGDPRKPKRLIVRARLVPTPD